MNEEIIELIRSLYEEMEAEQAYVLTEYNNSKIKVMSYLSMAYAELAENGVLNYDTVSASGYLEDLTVLMEQEQEHLIEYETGLLTAFLVSVYSKSFTGHASALVQSYPGSYMLNQNKIASRVNEAWSGFRFSDLIRENIEKLMRNIKSSFVSAARQGSYIDELRADIYSLFNTRGNHSRTMWDSETAFIIAESQNDAYEQAMLQEVIFTAVIDNKTTQFCKGHDNLIYRLADPNRPKLPAHFHCRSTYLPA